MNDIDREYLRENFKMLRKYGYAEIRHYIAGYLMALEVHGVISQEVHIGIIMVADDICCSHLRLLEGEGE